MPEQACKAVIFHASPVAGSSRDLPSRSTTRAKYAGARVPSWPEVSTTPFEEVKTGIESTSFGQGRRRAVSNRASHARGLEAGARQGRVPRTRPHAPLAPGQPARVRGSQPARSSAGQGIDNFQRELTGEHLTDVEIDEHVGGLAHTFTPAKAR